MVLGNGQYDYTDFSISPFFFSCSPLYDKLFDIDKQIKAHVHNRDAC